jgi:hypothetical protein
MKGEEFKEEFKRLVNFFGADRYPQEVAQGIWREVGGVSKEDLAATIDSFIQDSVKSKKPKVPNLDDFKNALFSQINSAKKEIAEGLKKKHADCPHCQGVGIVTYYLREKKWMAGTSYQCDCPLGEKLYPTIPKQFPGMEREYVKHSELHQLRKSEDGSSLPSEFSNTQFEDFIENYGGR